MGGRGRGGPGEGLAGGAGRGRRELVVRGGEASGVFKRKRGDTEPSSTPDPFESLVFVLLRVIGGERRGGGRPSTGTGRGACGRAAAAEREADEFGAEEEEEEEEGGGT